MKAKYLCGTDSEMMLLRNGHLVCAQPYVDGTKDEPQPLKCGGTVQRDNALIEFATAPANSRDTFIRNIGACFKDVREILPREIEFSISASANYPDSQLQHPETQEFYCDPDFNAWTMAMNEAPEGFEAGRFRSAAAHMHVGFVEDSGYDFLLDYEGKLDTIRTCDSFLGTASTILDNSTAAIQRRKLYGGPGSYRPTSYGVEYRTLSNFWIKSPVYAMWVHSFLGDILETVKDKKHIGLIKKMSPERIQSTILNGDVVMASYLMNRHVKPLLSKSSWTLFKESRILSLGLVDFKEEWAKMETYIGE